MVFGKENNNIIALVIPLLMSLLVGITSYVTEQIIDAEEEIREAYYNLDWANASLKARKLLLIALQKPNEVKFGCVFENDYASLERYTIVHHQAYDFALILLELAKK